MNSTIGKSTNSRGKYVYYACRMLLDVVQRMVKVGVQTNEMTQGTLQPAIQGQLTWGGAKGVSVKERAESMRKWC